MPVTRCQKASGTQSYTYFDKHERIDIMSATFRRTKGKTIINGPFQVWNYQVGDALLVQKIKGENHGGEGSFSV